jgi:hypothetical protein
VLTTAPAARIAPCDLPLIYATWPRAAAINEDRAVTFRLFADAERNVCDLLVEVRAEHGAERARLRRYLQGAVLRMRMARGRFYAAWHPERQQQEAA